MYVISQENTLYFSAIVIPERKLNFQSMLEDFSLSFWFLSRIKKGVFFFFPEGFKFFLIVFQGREVRAACGF